MMHDVRTVTGRREIESDMDVVVDDDCVWLFSVVEECFEYITELEAKAKP